MTNESIKILVTLMLFGGIRTAICVSEMPKSQIWFELLTALVSPVMPERAMQRVVRRRDR
jgi:hypothetical protein